MRKAGMSKRRFSDNELYILRNNIPVDILIEKILKISSRIIDGYFRFTCPVCREFNTGINLKTNLARCFRCERNYNTIDLVMLFKKTDFVQSVYFLKKIHINLLCHKRHASTDNFSSQIKSNNRMIGNKEIPRMTPGDLPAHISDIFKNMTPPKNDLSEQPVYDRIIELEKKIDQLSK